MSLTRKTSAMNKFGTKRPLTPGAMVINEMAINGLYSV